MPLLRLWSALLCWLKLQGALRKRCCQRCAHQSCSLQHAFPCQRCGWIEENMSATQYDVQKYAANGGGGHTER